MYEKRTSAERADCKIMLVSQLRVTTMRMNTTWTKQGQGRYILHPNVYTSKHPPTWQSKRRPLSMEGYFQIIPNEHEAELLRSKRT